MFSCPCRRRGKRTNNPAAAKKQKLADEARETNLQLKKTQMELAIAAVKYAGGFHFGEKSFYATRIPADVMEDVKLHFAKQGLSCKSFLRLNGGSAHVDVAHVDVAVEVGPEADLEKLDKSKFGSKFCEAYYAAKNNPLIHFSKLMHKLAEKVKMGSVDGIYEIRIDEDMQKNEKAIEMFRNYVIEEGFKAPPKEWVQACSFQFSLTVECVQFSLTVECVDDEEEEEKEYEVVKL
jgi:hypothetical protein